MVQSPSWEANRFAASQEIPRISRNPKVHYRTHKTTTENSYIPGVYNKGNSIWGPTVIPSQIFGLINNPMCPGEEETEQTRNYLILQCKKLRKWRNETIKQIKNTCGNWPTTNETFVINYSQIFVKFVESIHFTDLQWHFTIKDR